GYEFSRFPTNKNNLVTAGSEVAGLFDLLCRDQFCCIDSNLGALKSRDSTVAIDQRAVQPRVPSIFISGDNCLAQKAMNELIQSDKENVMNLATQHIEIYIIDRFLQVINNATEVSNEDQCKSALKRKFLDLKAVVKDY